MLYTEQTKKAMHIAFDAHKEQTDKTGLPFITLIRPTIPSPAFQ